MTVLAVGAYDRIRSDAINSIERDRLDPAADVDGVRAAVVAAVEGYQRRAHLGDGAALRDPPDMVARLLRSITEYGPMTELLARSDVEEVFIEGPRVSYIDGSGRLQGLSAPATEDENRQVVDRLLGGTQRHLDAGNPLVQARVLQGQARLTAAIPPVADALSATIRRHTLRRETLPGLIERGTLSPAAAGLLWAAMQTTSSLLVSGPPGAGKTSLLSALLAAAPSSHCIRCCEEIRELHVPLTHGSFYEARPPGMDGTAEVSLRDLVKFVLAMRPDHIVVGEVRGSEASVRAPTHRVRSADGTTPFTSTAPGSLRPPSRTTRISTFRRIRNRRCSSYDRRPIRSAARAASSAACSSIREPSLKARPLSRSSRARARWSRL